MVRAVGKRDLVWVKPSSTAGLADLKYGFNSFADDGDKGILGQTTITGATDMNGLIIGCNNIKPAKATKTRSTGSTSSSFCGADNYDEAIAANFKVGKPKISKRAARNGWIATINGVKYAFTSPPLPGSLTHSSLGLVPYTGQVDACFGCEFPKPPRAEAKQTDGSKVSTYMDPSVSTIPAGWRQSKASYTQYV
jgi:hypothetical protein